MMCEPKVEVPTAPAKAVLITDLEAWLKMAAEGHDPKVQYREDDTPAMLKEAYHERGKTLYFLCNAIRAQIQHGQQTKYFL